MFQGYKSKFYIYFLQDLFTYLKELQSYGEGERERKRSSTHQLIPKMAATARAEPSGKQQPETLTWSPKRVARAQTLGYLLLLVLSNQQRAKLEGKQ